MELQETMDLLYSKMRLVDPPSRVQVLKIAVGEHITFYDASYVATALKMGVPLITDDEELPKKVRSKEFQERVGVVKVMSSSDLSRTAKRYSNTFNLLSRRI